MELPRRDEIVELFTFHDDTFACQADGFEIEVVKEPYETVFERIRRRVIGE